MSYRSFFPRPALLVGWLFTNSQPPYALVAEKIRAHTPPLKPRPNTGRFQCSGGFGFFAATRPSASTVQMMG